MNHQEDSQKINHSVVEVAAKLKLETFTANVSLRIRDGIELRNLLSVIVNGLRMLLNCDRIVVYQLESLQYGKIIAESVVSDFMTIINQQIFDNCFQDHIVEQYLLGKIRVINDIHAAGLSNCHIKLLEKYSIKSSLVVPITIRGDEVDVSSFFKGSISHKNIAKESLWGFLIAHQCSEPRQWQSEDLAVLELLRVQIELSLQHMLAKFQTQAKSIELKHAHSRYKESEERFHQFTNNTRQVICLFEIYRSTYATLYVSPSYEDIFGKSCQSLYDDAYSFTQAVHPDDIGIVVDSYRQLRLGKQTSNEYRIIRPDGEIRWIIDRTFPSKNSSGQIDRASKIAEDISDRKRAEIELLQLKGQLALILKKPRHGWWDLDLVSNKVYYSPHWWEMIGYTNGELLASISTWQSLIYHEDREQVYTKYKEAEQDLEQNFIEIEYRLLHKQGFCIPVHLVAYFQRDFNFQVIRVCGSNSELTGY